MTNEIDEEKCKKSWPPGLNHRGLTYSLYSESKWIENSDYGFSVWACKRCGRVWEISRDGIKKLDGIEVKPWGLMKWELEAIDEQFGGRGKELLFRMISRYGQDKGEETFIRRTITRIWNRRLTEYGVQNG